jgi:hypothetical protein
MSCRPTPNPVGKQVRSVQGRVQCDGGGTSQTQLNQEPVLNCSDVKESQSWTNGASATHCGSCTSLSSCCRTDGSNHLLFSQLFYRTLIIHQILLHPFLFSAYFYIYESPTYFFSICGFKQFIETAYKIEKHLYFHP